MQYSKSDITVSKINAYHKITAKSYKIWINKLRTLKELTLATIAVIFAGQF